MKTAADLFRYDDGYLTSPNWLIVSGAVWIEDNAAGLGGAANQAIALWHETIDSREQLARTRFSIDRASDVPYAGLLLRAEYNTKGSPAFVRRAYLVTVSGAGNVRVYSLLMGVPAPVLIGSTTISGLTLGDENSHTLIAKARDGLHCMEQVTDILVYLDDEASPVLHVRDARTTRPEGDYVGFDIEDLDGTGGVTLGEFYTHVLRSAVIKNPQPVPDLKNFGDLKYELGYRLDRSGDAQTDDLMRGHYINYALAEVWRQSLWKWAFRVMHFTTQQGLRLYELPAYVGLEYDVVETGYGQQLGRGTRQDLRRLDPTQEAGGSPTGYTILGMGDLGGLVIELDRTPSGQSTMELPYYAKPIPMVEDTDIPIIPPEYNEILVFGALRRGAMQQSLQQLYQEASGEWSRMLADMKRANFRSIKSMPRMRTATELGRQKTYRGAGPVSRAEALGL